MKPGDWAERDVKVMNNGTADFNYYTDSRFRSGSDKLYNEMLLTVCAGGDVLYKGKLADFNQMEARPLASKTDEILKFRVDFPAELGNEFQGLTCSFQLQFYTGNGGAAGSITPAIGNGGALPNTGTNIFNALVSGIVLF